METIQRSVDELSTSEHDRQSDLETVLRFTQEMFGPSVKITEKADPEIFGRRYFIIEVVSKGNVEELLQLNKRWHSMLSQLASAKTIGSFTLSIIPED